MNRILYTVLFSLFFSTSILGLSLEYEKVFSKLDSPTAIQILPDNSILVSEKKGKIKLVTNNKSIIIYDFKNKLFNNDEGGLFDIKLDPNFKENRLIYFSYSGYLKEKSKRYYGLMLAKAKLYKSEIKTTKVPYSFRGMKVIYKFEHHLRKKYNFGGKLYISENFIFLAIGNRGYKNEILSNKNTMGTIIRINKDGEAYKSNPLYFSKKLKPEIFSFGHHHVNGISYDPFYNTFYSLETSPDNYNILNKLYPGKNYNWRLSSDRSQIQISKNDTRTPHHWWYTPIFPNSMIVYSHDKFKFMKGDLLIASKEQKHVRWVILKNKKIIKEKFLLEDLKRPISDIAQSKDGYIYVITGESSNASILKLYFNDNKNYSSK